MIEVSRQCIVRNRRGIHCRVATRLASVVEAYDAVVEIVTDQEQIVVSSILDILSLGLGRGREVTLKANGPDAVEALAAVESVLCQAEDP